MFFKHRAWYLKRVVHSLIKHTAQGQTPAEQFQTKLKTESFLCYSQRKTQQTVTNKVHNNKVSRDH